MFLLHVQRILKRDIATFEKPDVEVDVFLDRAEPVVAHQDQRRVLGQARLNLADASVDRRPEFIAAGLERVEFGFAAAAGGVFVVPDVPEFMLDSINCHEIEHEQIPLATLHQKLDGIKVMLKKRPKILERVRFVAVVVNRGRPRLIRADSAF